MSRPKYVYELKYIEVTIRVTHKGKDCKDDVKLLKHDNFKAKCMESCILENRL